MKKAFDITFKIGKVVNLIVAAVFALLFLINVFAIQDSAKVLPTIIFALLTACATFTFVFASKQYKKMLALALGQTEYVLLYVLGVFSVFLYTAGAILHKKAMEGDSAPVVSQPLIRLVKRDNSGLVRQIIIYGVTILTSLILGSIMLSLIGGTDPFTVIGNLFKGTFGTQRRVQVLFRDFALLLGVSAAIVPAFRMKFWNLGANGQILMGGVAAMFVMHNFGRVNDIGQFPRILLIVVGSVSMGAIWAAIPAIFKAFFRTNESLFTLMMNYIAVFIVNIAIAVWNPNGSGVIENRYYMDLGLVDLVDQYLLPIIIVAVITAFMTVYLRYSKHGYEISVVGESEKTAKYIGINNKKVIIRTMLLSGAICGVIGMILVAGINHSITSNVNGNNVTNLGFTAIMTVWLANCNPIAMIGTCFFVAFMSEGMRFAVTAASISNMSTVNVILGVAYFCIIACTFFINYKVIFRKRSLADLSKDVIDKGSANKVKEGA